MLQVFLFAANYSGFLDKEEGTPEQAVQSQLEVWNEEPEGSQLFWIVDEKQVIQATIMRDCNDPELAHVTYGDGRSETWRSHYVALPDGSYDRTEITKIS